MQPVLFSYDIAGRNWAPMVKYSRISQYVPPEVDFGNIMTYTRDIYKANH